MSGRGREEPGDPRTIYDPFVVMKLTADDDGVRPWAGAVPENQRGKPTVRQLDCIRLVSHIELGRSHQPGVWSGALEVMLTNLSPDAEGPLLVKASMMDDHGQYFKARATLLSVPAKGTAVARLEFSRLPTLMGDDGGQYNVHISGQGPRLRLPGWTEWRLNRLCAYANIWPALLT